MTMCVKFNDVVSTVGTLNSQRCSWTTSCFLFNEVLYKMLWYEKNKVQTLKALFFTALTAGWSGQMVRRTAGL